MHEMCVKVKSPCSTQLFVLALLPLGLHVTHAHLGSIYVY